MLKSNPNLTNFQLEIQGAGGESRAKKRGKGPGLLDGWGVLGYKIIVGV
jgi:hypothetical protein